jgi:hypothetical protein
MWDLALITIFINHTLYVGSFFFSSSQYGIKVLTLPFFLCSSNSPFPLVLAKREDSARGGEAGGGELTRGFKSRDQRNPKISQNYSLEVLQHARPNVLGKLPSHKISKIPSSPISTNTSLSNTILYKEIKFQ